MNQNVCFFIVVINRGGGQTPVIKNFVPLLFCSVGPPENRPKDDGKPPKLPKIGRKTTETGANFYKFIKFRTSFSCGDAMNEIHSSDVRK